MMRETEKIESTPASETASGSSSAPDRSPVGRRLRFPARAAWVIGSTLATVASSMVSVEGAQDQPPPRVFGEVIDVRVVNVEAVVTDAEGNRVYGLGAQDFRLYVDGREMPIEYFTEIQGGRAMPQEADGAATHAPSSLPSMRAGEAVGMSFLVFIDDYYTIKKERDQILRKLRTQVPLVRPEDRMALVAFDGKHLEMLTSWSHNHVVLERAFDQAIERPTYGIFRRTERFPGFGLGASETSGGNEIANLERRTQLERVTKAVTSTLRSFAMPEGRKVMLMITGEWPAASFFESFGQGTLNVQTTDLKLASPIAETANLLGYTLYPIDTAGIRDTGGGVSAIAPATIQPINDPQTPFEVVLAPGPAGSGISREAFRAATLRHIARQTGGRALLGAGRFEALPAVAEDTGSFYWLGFTADRQHDGVHHRIRLVLDRPGLRVRNRRGYRDLSRGTELSMMTQSALLFGNPLEASVLGIELGAPQRIKRGRMQVPLRVAIPADEITLLPAADGFVAEIELRVAAKDPDGNLSRMPAVPLRLSRPELPRPGQRFYYETNLTLRRRKHELVVSVHDVASGNTVTSVATVAP